MKVSVNNHFADSRPDVDMTVFGGRRQPLQVNLECVKRWIETCQFDYGDICDKAEAGLRKVRLEIFHLINVNNRNIHTFANCNMAHRKYMNLSYVWGRTQKLTCKSA